VNGVDKVQNRKSMVFLEAKSSFGYIGKLLKTRRKIHKEI